MAIVIKIAAGVLGLYVLVLLGFYFGQRALMYVPDRQRVDPASIGLADVRERILAAPDGARLVTWQAKAQAPTRENGRISAAQPGKDAAPTILYFHGNAGNLASRGERIGRFQQRGFNVLMLSYRGFSGSTGSPSEAVNIADAELAYQALLDDGVRARDIVIFGESLGTGVAIQLAAKHDDAAGLILDAPFTSMTDAAAFHYPWVWASPFLKDRYDNAVHIRAVKLPVLILHGEMDHIVPVAMGRKLAAIAGPAAQLKTYPGGGHVNLDSFGAQTDIAAFMQRVTK